MNDSLSINDGTHSVILRRESIDILSSSLDNIGKDTTFPNTSYRKESDASALLALGGLRKESDASGGLYSLSSMRKESDASALSTLMRDEEAMMQEEEEAITITNGYNGYAHTGGGCSLGDSEHEHSHEHSHDLSHEHEHASSRGAPPFRKDSDPFENLRKLSDASDAVSALRKMSEGSDPLKGFRKDSDVITLGDGTLGDFKSPDTADFVLGQLKMKLERDDGSIALFENPDLARVEPTPVFQRRKGNLCSSALEHLDALGSEKHSDDGSTSTVTINEAQQRMLMDALLGGSSSRRNRAESWGGMSDISHHQAALIGNLASAADISTSDMPRRASPLGFEGHRFEGALLSPRSNSQDSLNRHLQPHENVNVAKRWKVGGDVPDVPDKIRVPIPSRGRERFDSFSGLTIPTPRVGREMSGSFSRERLDSWAPRDRLESIVTRDRLDSLANLSGIFSKGRDRLDSLASLGDVSLNMSIGDLEDVAGKLESIMHGGDSEMEDYESVDTSQQPSRQLKGALPAPTIHVDSEAVQSAVQAAMAATSGCILDMLRSNSTPGKPPGQSNSGKVSAHAATPLTSNAKIKHGSVPLHVASTPMDESKMEEIRARARAAAGYVHPGTGHPAAPKSKKRPLPLPDFVQSSFKKTAIQGQFSTPIANPKIANPGRVASGVHMYSDFASSTPKMKNYGSGIKSTPSSSSKGGQSNQKWEEMFDCLVVYVREQKGKETQAMSEEETKTWEWSGNVPTMYKTTDGKALGRWINNQRSAKSKGSLKSDREQRLVGTGLKWSVLTTNAWTDMMEELKLYVEDKVSYTRLGIICKIYLFHAHVAEICDAVRQRMVRNGMVMCQQITRSKITSGLTDRRLTKTKILGGGSIGREVCIKLAN